ncbi:hypothetical protein CYY_010417, partial [Polysphondylium violaceum]
NAGNNGLTKVQIAGIVIGAAGFAAVVVVSVSYAVYKRKQFVRLRKNMETKIETFNK